MNADITVGASGLPVDLIVDFATGVDTISFEEGGGFDIIDGQVTTFESIGVDYDGTNSVAGGISAYIFDGTHLIYDDDVATAGYQVIANMNGATVVEADISFIAAGGGAGV